MYDDYKSVVGLPPDSESGRAVFRKHCANCHRLDREGFAVGPDLFGIRNQAKAAILLHILIPEQEITQGFAAYVVETKDGRTLTGLIASETPVSVTLRQPLGKEETVLRSDIERLLSSKLSLMPQELEKVVSRQEFADLLSYLKGENMRDSLPPLIVTPDGRAAGGQRQFTLRVFQLLEFRRDLGQLFFQPRDLARLVHLLLAPANCKRSFCSRVFNRSMRFLAFLSMVGGLGRG